MSNYPKATGRWIDIIVTALLEDRDFRPSFSILDWIGLIVSRRASSSRMAGSFPPALNRVNMVLERMEAPVLF
jgi:hypothetical protein